MPPKREFNWVNVAFLSLSPLAAFGGLAVYVSRYGFHAADMVSFWLMVALTGLGITAGYHRYYSHRTYECHWSLQLVYLLFGAAALENSVLHWAADHRLHHRYVDQEQDPYNIMKGILWAHMGWILFKGKPNRGYENVPDLTGDPLVVWQDRWYLPIAIAVGFALPALIGLAFGRPFAGLLWGGFLRVVIVHHGTFLINSAAHFIGTQPYSNKDSSRDNWWLAFITFGEGYHNYHHAFQGDYRNGIRWYHWDPSKWWIGGLSLAGLTWRLNRASELTILKARMRMEYLKVQPFIEGGAGGWRETLRQRLETGQKRLELAMFQYQDARRRYHEWASDARARAVHGREQLREQWKLRLKECRVSAGEAKTEYFRLVRQVRRSYSPGFAAFVALMAAKFVK